MSETTASGEFSTNLTAEHTRQVFNVVGNAITKGVVDFPTLINDAASRPATAVAFEVLEQFRIADEKSHSGDGGADACEVLYEKGLPVQVSFATESDERVVVDGAIIGVYGNADIAFGGVMVCVGVSDGNTVWSRDAVIYPTSPARMGCAFA